MAEWLERLKEAAQRSAEAVRKLAEREQIALIVGQVAGRTVRDSEGGVLVEAGQTITAEIAERARAAGRLGALVACVAAAGIQDLQERLDALRAETPEGKEQLALESVDLYAEARHYIGRDTGTDVTDVRGNVVIPAGTRLREEHVRLARERRLLNALIESASVAWQGTHETSGPGTPEEGPSRAMEDEPLPVGRRRLPLLDPSAPEGADGAKTPPSE